MTIHFRSDLYKKSGLWARYKKSCKSISMQVLNSVKLCTSQMRFDWNVIVVLIFWSCFSVKNCRTCWLNRILLSFVLQIAPLLNFWPWSDKHDWMISLFTYYKYNLRSEILLDINARFTLILNYHDSCLVCTRKLQFDQ